MKDTGLFILVAFLIGEIINILFLLPILNSFYEPYLAYGFALRNLVWILLYIILPTSIGGAIELSVMKFLNGLSK